MSEHLGRTQDMLERLYFSARERLGDHPKELVERARERNIWISHSRLLSPPQGRQKMNERTTEQASNRT